MGEMVSFPVKSGECSAYLAKSDGAKRGVVVIQEWWGLVDHIKDVADRFANQGFIALAPDLYHGEAAKEPDEASKLMMTLDARRALADMVAAASYLRGLGPDKVGCVGFCMGGALSILLGSASAVDGAVAYYGTPSAKMGEIDYGRYPCPLLGHYAEHDEGMGAPSVASEIVDQVKAGGQRAELHVYEGAHHAFFNDTRPQVYDEAAAKTSWERTLSFFRTL